jgi:hypothetical protein
MAIFFNCTCGQDLRADEAREGSQLECPACGRRVPVPSLALANYRLGIGPPPLLLLPEAAPPPPPLPPPPLRLALPERRPPPAPSEGAGAPRPERPPRKADIPEAVDHEEWQRWEARRLLTQAHRDLDLRHRYALGWPREKHWFECLLYPMRASLVLLILAVTWATLAAFFVALFAEDWDMSAPGPALLLVPPMVVLFFLLAYTCAFFRCVLASASEGESGVIRWPGGDLLQVLWSGAACLVCFVAGPLLPGVVAFLFWLNSGDLEWVDEIILVELGLVAICSWVLALLAVDRSGRLRDANPIALAQMARRLGWRGWLLVVLASSWALVLVPITMAAMGELHHSALGWIALGWWGFWGMAWVVFLLRWYGLSQFRATQQRRAERQQAQEPILL